MAAIEISSSKSANTSIDSAAKNALKLGLNCIPDSDFAKVQFSATRRLWGKTTGIQVHHVKQSFKPNETTITVANEIGKKLAEMIAPNFEVLVYTHDDNGRMYNNIIINSVSYTDGSKFLSTRKTLYSIRELSDKLCKEYGLSIIDRPKVRYTAKEKYLLETGKTSWKEEIRKAIKKEKLIAKNFESFKLLLFTNHKIEIEVNDDSIVYKDSFGNTVRDKTLGTDFELNYLEQLFEES